MDALVLEEAGVAVVADGDSFLLIKAGEPDFCEPFAGTDLRAIGDAPVAGTLLENCDLSAARRALDGAYSASCTRVLLLIGLDGALSVESRKAALIGVEEEVRDDSSIVANVEAILYAAPLPQSADIDRAIAIAQDAALVSCTSILVALKDAQPRIARVREAFDVAAARFFEVASERDAALSSFARAGAFRELTAALAGRRSASEVVLGLLTQDRQPRFPRYREFVVAWTAPLRTESRSEPLVAENESFYSSEDEPIRSKRRRASIDRQAALESVQGRKRFLVQLMKGGNLDGLRAGLDDLVEFQRSKGGAKHVVKSLCDLAIEAKSLGLLQLQGELTARAVALKPDDGWSWAQHADSLIGIGKLHDALEAYRNAELFGAASVGVTGQAHVLRWLGDFDRSRALFDRALLLDPRDTFAKNGRAEVLKALGRLPEALAAYDDVRREHPESVAAKTGRAEVLKALGRLPEALAAYDSVQREHPENVVAKNGRAEVLKALGRLPEALAAYDDVRHQHPEDVVAKTGRAEVLKALGRLPEALAAYDNVRRQHPEDAVAKAGRAEVLKALGRLPEALAAYDDVSHQHPENVVAKAGRAEVLKALGRLPEALTAYDEIRREHPTDVVPKNGRAEVLKALGLLPEALAAYDEALRQHPEDIIVRTGRAGVLRNLNRLPEAIADYRAILADHPWNRFVSVALCTALACAKQYAEALERIGDADPVTSNDWIALHVKGMIFLRQERFDEAIRVFEYGLSHTPWASQRENFGAGLALARIKRRAFRAAVEALGAEQERRILSFEVFRLHAAGAIGDRERAKRAYSAIIAEPDAATVVDLAEELARRYLGKGPSRHDEAWIVEREEEMLLNAAA